MDPDQILRIVDSLHRDKNIDTEIVFRAIESAFASAARRQYGDTSEVIVTVSRENGSLAATLDGEPLDPAEMIGRIGAQMAKQVIIQKIREAERDSLVEEYHELEDQIVNGSVQRVENSLVTVQLSSVEAILPRSEQIPGESHHSGERIRAMVCEVRPQGTRVKVVLSRSRPRFVQRLFEQEIPEISEGVISINALSREPGYRSKVAVSSTDSRVDCVGACVGVRGNRIRSIVDELNSERIDIVRWDEDPEIMIPNALQPAEVDQVLLCDMIGRAIVLVREDQLSLAIGRRGQNVRLASKLCGWDIEIMTAEELDEQIDRAVTGYSALDGVDENLAGALVEQGYLSYDDLSVIEPDALAEMGGLTMEEVDHIVEQAETRAEEAEAAALEARERQKAQAAADAEAAAQQALVEASQPTEGSEETAEESAENDSEAASDDAEATEEVSDASVDTPAAEDSVEDAAEQAPAVAEEEAEQAEEEAVVEESNEEVTETTDEELAEADEQAGDE
ncbi:MAG: transcription termination factor NusA [Pirellulales bacterium]|nr:transcription termination factor NusA [Pirellulales bacterium]